MRWLKVMFVDVKPIHEMTNLEEVPIPSVGDDVEIHGELYSVVKRTWSVEPYAVAIYVRRR